MQEIRIDKSELERLIDRLDGAPGVLQTAKKKAIAAVAPKLKQEVDSQIGGTGKVRGWQGQFVGSKGGYAAVRPKAKTYIETKGKRPSRGGPKKYAVGYVTNAVNSGHRFPSSSGAAKRYKPRIKSGQMNVPGKRFYETAEAQASRVAQETGEQIVRELIDHLEG